MKKIMIALLIASFAFGNIFIGNAKTYRATQKDPNGRVAVVTLSDGDNERVFEPVKQYRYKYNENGLVSEKTIYSWNSYKSKWQEVVMYQYRYDSINQLSEMQFAEWNKDKFEWGNHADTFFVDLNNEKLLSINYLNTFR